MTHIDKLFDNFDNCVGFKKYINPPPHFPYARQGCINKISDIYYNKTDTEIRTMIDNLQKLLKNFNINRDKILDDVPKPSNGNYNNNDFKNEKRYYVSNTIEKSLGNLSLYVYPIDFLHEQYIHVYDRDILDVQGIIDTIPKYLECHILLYKNILRLKLNKPMMNLSEFTEETLREEKEKQELISKKKEKKRFRKEKRLKKIEEEKQQLKEEEEDEKKRLKKEVDNFIKNDLVIF